MKTEDERLSLERAILSALITDYDRFIDYLDLQPTDFRKPNSDILRLMLEYKTWDPLVLASKTKDIPIEELRELAAEIIGCNESTFEEYVEALRDIVNREKLIRNLNTITANLKDGADLNKIYWELNNLKADGESETNMRDVLQTVIKQAKWIEAVKIVPTGYTELDKLIWGFEKGQVVVIGARPWVWKSMFAINLINNNVLRGEKVALFSLEMNGEQVMRRLLAMNSWVWVWQLKNRADTTDQQRIDAWAERLEKQLDNLEIYDNVHTISQVERKIRYLVHKKWTTIFYLDYLQLIRNPSIKNNPIEALTDMSQRLKQLALELGITIVELSQLNRESDKTLVKRASQLRGSWSIEQDADMIWILDKEDEQWEKLLVSVQKCRDWRIGDINLKQVSDIMRIIDLPLNKPF
jgi:replicative DNA helicase